MEAHVGHEPSGEVVMPLGETKGFLTALGLRGLRASLSMANGGGALMPRLKIQAGIAE